MPSAEFLFLVQADESAERAPPVLCASAPGLKSIFFRPHPPFPFPCSAKWHCKCECTQRRSSGSRYPTALVWQSSLSCARVPSWPSVRRFSIYLCLFLDVGLGYWDIHIYTLPIVSSRVSFSARPLSDVAASQAPSVAAAAEILYSIWSAVEERWSLSGYEFWFKVGRPNLTFGCSCCLLVAVALGLDLDALGVGVGLSGFCFFSVGSNHGRSMGTDPRTSSDP